MPGQAELIDTNLEVVTDEITLNDLMRLYDLLKREQDFYKPALLREHLEYHYWSNSIIRINSGARIKALAFFWRVNEDHVFIPGQTEEPTIDPNGTVAHIHYAWLDPRYRRKHSDSRLWPAGCLTELLTKGMALHPWCKKVRYTRVTLGKRLAGAKLTADILDDPKNLKFREWKIG